MPNEEGEVSIVLRDPEGFSDQELALNEQALFVAAHFDGRHSLPEAIDSFERRFGVRPRPAEITALQEQLDRAFFLETESFDRHRRRMIDAFARTERRPPAHAGVSYPADPEEAALAVAAFFEAAAGLEEDGPRPEGRLQGIIAPHIDLRVGGPCTALAYRLLAETPAADTVVVLGTSHACPVPAWVVLDKAFATPLGDVPVDPELCRRLAAAAPVDPGRTYYHRREHAVEFQALFLAALRNAGRNLAFVPVLCGSLRDRENAGPHPFLDELHAVIEERGESLVVVAGADLAHVGPRFGDPAPLSEEHLRLLESKDRSTLRFAAAGDAEGFYGAVAEAGDPRRICGLAPVYGLLRSAPPLRGKVLRYEQATDTTGTVSYAALGLWVEAGS
jgi:hypothetical protein